MSHMQLIEDAKVAAHKVFGDKSVPVSTTKELLQEIADEIEIMLYALDCDERRQCKNDENE